MSVFIYIKDIKELAKLFTFKTFCFYFFKFSKVFFLFFLFFFFHKDNLTSMNETENCSVFCTASNGMFKSSNSSLFSVPSLISLISNTTKLLFSIF